MVYGIKSSLKKMQNQKMREMRRLNVLDVGKLGIELENVRRWNITAVARKNISRECNAKKGGLRWEREEVSKEEKKMAAEQKAEDGE